MAAKNVRTFIIRLLQEVHPTKEAIRYWEQTDWTERAALSGMFSSRWFFVLQLG